MGCSSSCKIFEEFTTAIHWVLENKLDLPAVTHYVDDFILVNYSHDYCENDLQKFQLD